MPGKWQPPKTGWTFEVEARVREAALLPGADAFELRSLGARAACAVDVRLASPIEFDEEVSNVLFLAGDTRLAVSAVRGSPQCKLVIYDVETRQPVASYCIDAEETSQRRKAEGELIRWREGFRELAASSDGQWLAAGTRDGQVHCFDLQRGDAYPVKSWKAHNQPVTCLAFSPDGNWLYSTDATWDRVKRWDVHNEWGEVPGPLERPNPAAAEVAKLPKARAIALSPDGRWLYTNEGQLLDARTLLPHPVQFEPLEGDGAFSSDGQFLATGHHPHMPQVRVFDLRYGSMVCRVQEQGRISVLGRHLQFAAGDRLLVASGADGRVRLWDAFSGRLHTWVKVADVASPRYAISRDGRRLATFHGQTVSLYDVQLPEAFGTIAHSQEAVTDMEWQQHTSSLVTAHRHANTHTQQAFAIAWWNLATGEQRDSWISRAPANVQGEVLVPFPEVGEVAVSSVARVAASLPWMTPVSFAASGPGGLQLLPVPGQTVGRFEEESFRPAGDVPLEIVSDPLASNGQAARLAGVRSEVQFGANADMAPAETPFSVLAIMRSEGEQPATSKQGVHFHADRDNSLLANDLRRRYEVHLVDAAESGILRRRRKYRPFVQVERHSPAALVDQFLILPAAPVREGWIGTQPITQLQYCPSGRRLWALLDQERVLGWRMPEGALEVEFDHRTAREQGGDTILTVLDASDELLLIGTRQGDVLCGTPRGGTLHTRRFRGPGGSISSLRIFADAKQAAIADVNGELQIQRVSDGGVVQTLEAGRSAIRAIEISSDGATLLAAGDARVLHMWKRQPAKTPGGEWVPCMRLPNLPGEVRSLRMTPDQRHLFILLEGEHAVRTLDLGKLEQTLTQSIGIQEG